jgi:uncharacterized protein
LSRFRAIFPDHPKVLIAMVHLPALPGTPLYSPQSNLERSVEVVTEEVEKLVSAGFDAVLFSNENDRPFEFKGRPESAAFLTRFATECRPRSIPHGIDFLLDPKISLAAAMASGAGFIRESTTGLWDVDAAIWDTRSSDRLRHRRYFDRDDLAVFIDITTPPFASPQTAQPPTDVALLTAKSLLADAILVSGANTGIMPDLSTLADVRNAVPAEIPVLLDTGARADNVAEILKIADGCIVGTSIKIDGRTENLVDIGRAKRFVEAARN